MSLKSSTKVETNVYELEVSVDAAKFQEAVTKAYNKQKKNITVPGFRKGKAPKNIVERMYGKEVFYDDAIEMVYPEAVESAIKEAELDFIGTADAEVVSVGDEGLELKFRVIVKPEVELGEYKGLKAVKMNADVTAEDVQAELDRMLQQNARMVTVEDRAAQDGDLTVIDFEGFVDGVAFEGGKGENYNLTLGSNQFIPGFEAQIVGHKTGEEFDVNVTFPEEYAPELAGKDATFKIKLHEIKFSELPEADDDFAKDASEFETIAELKADIEKKLSERKAEEADHDFEHKLVEQVANGIKAEIPEMMIENAIDENIKNMDYRLQMQGLNLDQYLQYTGMEIGAFRDGFREQAELQVKTDLALEKIVAAENIAVSDEDLEAEYTKLAEMYSMEADAVKKAVPAESLKRDLAFTKAIELIKESAVAEKEKPAKKTAAKKTTKKAAKADDAEEKPAKKTTRKKAAAKTEEAAAESAE